MIMLSPSPSACHLRYIYPRSLRFAVLKYTRSGQMHTYAPMDTIFFGHMFSAVLTLIPCTAARL